MSLEKVGKEILRETEIKASQIIADGQMQAKSFIEQAKKDAVELSDKINAQTKMLIEELRQTELSGIFLEQNKEFMKAKQAILQEIFEETKKQIMFLDKTKRSQIIKNLCLKAKKNMESAKFVYANSEDKKILTEAIEAKGLVFKETADIWGGIIVENQDKNIRVNYSFGEILQKSWEENLHGISSRIFEKN